MIDSAIFAFGKCDWDPMAERERNAKIRVEGVPDIRVKDSGVRPTAITYLSFWEGWPAVCFAVVADDVLEKQGLTEAS